MSLRSIFKVIHRSNFGSLHLRVPVSRICVKSPATLTHHRSSSSEGISRYPVPNKKNLPFDIVELMEEVEQKGGFLPNVFKVLSHRPAEFRAFFSYYNALMNKESGGLSKADRELIVVATSAHNHCLYCVVSHSALHRIYSKKPMLADQVAVNYKAAELTARERAMLDFARTVCRSQTITEEHFSTLETHGFDRDDIWDIAAIAAFFAMSNRLAHLTDMRPNTEFYNMGRVPRDKANPSGQQVKGD
ncbi:uncharacterized protein si:ch211-175m2.5 isoform X1 [Triplophysa rosa]|uniref:Carboxymuconolactone decarboxylase-like domain-containing protein n=2 Tax=Triplophysa rosa TaxID=992332 RepID=A0A9W7WHK1_TRIRA|nr:uncharacterized protein si:ch211-175m2.5 isoform X1 [Triplophysa rosa]XP_057206238.1 uncharacterized protein si:ch211-175m2.5 isoform X1 [Triplophysa rosa]XP_057206239.1 uncharacterized protein si:ch211-175m2.5 isoform X1 [Triplophysa rosa]KAI7801962.1 hypothetical protein IRJ41_019724 [Triplophysa rosa]